LNVFALTANFAAAVSLILTLRRLCGTSFAIVAAALFAVYALVALPFLVGNYWNPILPVLPLALLSLIAARWTLGSDDRVLPIVVFLASVIVQTHIGFAPEAIASIAVALVIRGFRLVESARSELHAASRGHRFIALGVLILMWALPLYEAATANPGNLQRIVAFFATGALGQHSLNEATRTVLDQSAVMPFALARTLRLFQGTVPPWGPGSSQASNSRQSERSWPSQSGGGRTCWPSSPRSRWSKRSWRAPPSAPFAGRSNPTW